MGKRTYHVADFSCDQRKCEARETRVVLATLGHSDVPPGWVFRIDTGAKGRKQEKYLCPVHAFVGGTKKAPT